VDAIADIAAQAANPPGLATIWSAILWSGTKHAPTVSQPKLTMRAKAHKFEAVVIRLAVDENEILA
jgi:hypothetical protein